MMLSAGCLKCWPSQQSIACWPTSHGGLHMLVPRKGKEGLESIVCCCFKSHQYRVLELLSIPAAGVCWLPQQSICFWQCVDTGSASSVLLVLSTHVQDRQDGLGKRDHGSGPFTLFACECVNGVCGLSQQLICCWQCVASRHSAVQLCSQHLCRASRPVSATETMAVLGLTPCLHVQVWQHLLVCLGCWHVFSW